MSRDEATAASQEATPDGFWDRLMHPDEKRLEDWRQTWSKVLGRDQTLADAAEANRNFFGLIQVLAQIDARRRASAEEPTPDEIT